MNPLNGTSSKPADRPARWYNIPVFIEEAVKNLSLLNDLVIQRRLAYYERKEALEEFIVLGTWLMDSCGNFMRAVSDGLNKTPAEAYEMIGKTIPDVITLKEVDTTLKEGFPTEQDVPHMMFSSQSYLPEHGLSCPRCGLPWNIDNCRDAITKKSDKTVSLDSFVGRTIGHVFRAYENMCYAIYSPRFELMIRNDRFIDLSPKYPDSTEEWEKGIIKNAKGWVGFIELAKLAGLDEVIPHTDEYLTEARRLAGEYVIQPGDETFFYVCQYYHKGCLQDELDAETAAEFLNAFSEAGILIKNSVVIPNEYGSRGYRGQWFKFSTDIGDIKIGWRKRVVTISFSNPDIKVRQLFEDQDVTKGDNFIHAWAMDKVVEYLLKAAAAARQTKDASAAGKDCSCDREAGSKGNMSNNDMNEGTAEWITSEDQVATTTDASLRRSLLTSDGRGARLKAVALDELIRRAEKREKRYNQTTCGGEP